MVALSIPATLGCHGKNSDFVAATDSLGLIMVAISDNSSAKIRVIRVVHGGHSQAILGSFSNSFLGHF